MAHAGDRLDNRSGFTVASSAIPLGVHCRGCGRLLLPARLWPLAIRPLSRGCIQVELRCVRCNAVGRLLLDSDDADHRVLLTMWCDQHPDGLADAGSTGTRGTT